VEINEWGKNPAHLAKQETPRSEIKTDWLVFSM
jgi:hypothetical protein